MRNRMSLKKAKTISSARKSPTSNPFIVFGFYDILEKVVSKKRKICFLANMDSRQFRFSHRRWKISDCSEGGSSQ